MQVKAIMTSIRSAKKLSALSICAVCLGVLAGRLIPRLTGVYAQVTETPQYTLIFNERYEGIGSEKLPQATQVLAVRADGSTASSHRTKWTGHADAVPGGIFEWRHIVDLARQQQVSVYPFARATTTVPIGDAMIEKMRMRLGPRQDCAGDSRFVREERSDKILLSYATEHYVYEAIGGSDFVRWEEWRAPQLGCVALKRTLSVTPPGAGARGSTIEIQDIIPGEPPAEYFVIPEDYKEHAPSEVYNAVVKAEGRELMECESQLGPRADANYYRQRGEVPPNTVSPTPGS
jgi:hypothetical protein